MSLLPEIINVMPISLHPSTVATRYLALSARSFTLGRRTKCCSYPPVLGGIGWDKTAHRVPRPHNGVSPDHTKGFLIPTHTGVPRSTTKGTNTEHDTLVLRTYARPCHWQQRQRGTTTTRQACTTHKCNERSVPPCTQSNTRRLDSTHSTENTEARETALVHSLCCAKRKGKLASK
eukprot:792581-Amphidinium_carterae.2